MVKMKTTDIEDMGNVVLIKIPDSKTRKLSLNEVITPSASKTNLIEPSASHLIAENLTSSAQTSTVLHGFNFQNATLTNCTFNISLTNKNDV